MDCGLKINARLVIGHGVAVVEIKPNLIYNCLWVGMDSDAKPFWPFSRGSDAKKTACIECPKTVVPSDGRRNGLIDPVKMHPGIVKRGCVCQ